MTIHNSDLACVDWRRGSRSSRNCCSLCVLWAAPSGRSCHATVSPHISPLSPKGSWSAS